MIKNKRAYPLEKKEKKRLSTTKVKQNIEFSS